MKRNILSIITLVVSCFTMSADEGMWMIHTVDHKTQAIGNCIVSIDFMGTGSLISDQGLVITNHHVSYDDVYSLSTPEKNYLKDGFWAYDKTQEIPVHGRHMQILEKTIDVTDEVNELIANGTVKKTPMMMRRLSGLMEEKYEKEYGLVASLGSFWKGEKWYISLYRQYSDIRLVAAPPESIGAFGGDIDNWEWPQHKGDFAMYRIYTAPDGSPAEYSKDNVPLNSTQYLRISTKGYREGQQTMILGFPGRTDRFAGSAKVEFKTNVTLPVESEVRGARMDIIKKWMDKDEDIRLKYSDFFFGLSNAQELYHGEMQCYKRFAVADEKRAKEEELNKWIDANDSRKEKWGNLTADLARKYAAIAVPEKDLCIFRECIPRGTRLSVVASRTGALGSKRTNKNIASTRATSAKNYAEMDLRVERDLFRYVLGYYFDNISPECLGPFHKELKDRFGRDYDAMCAYLWDDSFLTNEKSIAEYLESDENIEKNIDKYLQDPLLKYFQEGRITVYNNRINDAQGKPYVSELNQEYTHAMYEMALDKKAPIYPDANSTLRVTFGKVCALSPKDAVHCDYYSTVQGLKEKYNPSDRDFYMKPDYRTLLDSADPKMKINFLSDCDITGGNSGSPIMNMKGEVIGLAFDGNKESLAGDSSFTPDYNRTVSVDIRYVLWILRNYAHLDNILEEIGL